LQNPLSSQSRTCPVSGFSFFLFVFFLSINQQSQSVNLLCHTQLLLLVVAHSSSSLADQPKPLLVSQLPSSLSHGHSCTVNCINNQQFSTANWQKDQSGQCFFIELNWCCCQPNSSSSNSSSSLFLLPQLIDVHCQPTKSLAPFCVLINCNKAINQAHCSSLLWLIAINQLGQIQSILCCCVFLCFLPLLQPRSIKPLNQSSACLCIIQIDHNTINLISLSPPSLFLMDQSPIAKNNGCGNQPLSSAFYSAHVSSFSACFLSHAEKSCFLATSTRHTTTC